MNTKNQPSRREFFTQSLRSVLGASLALPVLGTIEGILSGLFARSSSASELPPVNPNDQVARAIGYYEDAAAVDVKKFPKRANAEGKKQFCKNCVLYKGPETGRGNCTLFPKGTVTAAGWCNSWVAKPGT